jgi:hypothetical protein
MRAQVARSETPLSRRSAEAIAETADDAWPKAWLDGIAGASPGFQVPDEPIETVEDLRA